MTTFRPRGYSINDFCSWYERDELVLMPKFQRRDVWSQEAKSHLIDTILRGLPAPLIFIRQQVNPSTRKTVRDVVDGQQRLRSVISFVNDEFPVIPSQNESFGGLRFSELPEPTRGDFLSYEFSVVVLEGATDAVLLDIFARLNTYAQKLNAQELLNAQYYGEFKQTVYSLGYEHLEFWRNNGILHDKQIMRMAEAELASQLVVTMLAGVQNCRSLIQEFCQDKDEKFPERIRWTPLSRQAKGCC